MVKSIARHLESPCRAGVYISIPDLVAVARSLDLPIVVKDTREWMIEELFKTALLTINKVEELVDKLIELIRSKDSSLGKLLEQYPLAESFYREYRDNARKTIEKLEELKRIYVTYYAPK